MAADAGGRRVSVGGCRADTICWLQFMS